MIQIRNPERGSAAFMVAVSLFLLLGFVALAIDASLGYDERRDLQNAADNAALAAAYESCSPRVLGSPDPVAVARDVAQRNGFIHDGASTIVTAQELVPAEWTVAITQADMPGQFGQATPYAADSLTVYAEATATCAYQPFLGGYAVFAGGVDCPPDELNMSGDDIEINGSVHTNQDMSLTGSDPVVNGDITYVPPGGANLSGSNTATATTVQDYPLDPELFFEYRPAGDRASAAGSNYHDFTGNSHVQNQDIIDAGLGTGSNTTLEITASGIYYAPDDMTLKGVALAPGVSVTLIAEGTISVIADGDIVGYDAVDPDNPNSTKLTAFSWNIDPTTCAPGPATAVSVSGSSFAWEGLVFAPNGLVNFSASGSSSLDGSIIAYTINLSGSELSVSYDDSANADPTFTIDLLS